MTFFFSSLLGEIIGVVTTLIACLYGYYLWAFQYWKNKNVPYLEPSIPWGNFENPRKRTMPFADYIQSMYQKAKARGWKHFGIYAFMKPIYVVVDLDLAKHIMSKDFHKFLGRGIYTNERDDPLSCHLLALTGTKWRDLRIKLTPTFTSGKMKAMFSTLVECGSVLEKYVEQHMNNEGGVDIKNMFGNFTTDIVGSCAFGLDCSSFKDPNSPFRVYGKKIFAKTKTENLKQAFFMNFQGLAKFIGLRMFPKEVNDFFIKVIDDTVTYRENNHVTRNDFLQLLIDMKNNKESQAREHIDDEKTLTMNEIAAQAFLFFLAGFETSSTTMTFALFLLAQHQDIQDKVREEIERVLAKHDGNMTYDSLSELKYMKQVIDETLRMYSPIPLLTRVSEDDYKVPGEDVVLEKGTRVFIPIQGIHMDEEYYENPTVFDPERFNEENKATRHPYAHLPFGEGPRMCIGERFGIMQTKVGLTTILKNFRVTLNKRTKLPLKFSLTSLLPDVEGGIWLNIEKL